MIKVQNLKTKMSKIKIIKLRLSSSALLLTGAIMTFGIVSSPIVNADSYTAQIQDLQNQNSQVSQNISGLENQASTYQGEINQLQVQISAIQSQIASTQANISEVQDQIQANQIKLTQEKATLDNIIKSMYVNGNLSTLEMLATSNNLSDFVTKEEYQNIVQNQIQSTLAQINATQATLKQQNAQLNVALFNQTSENSQLSSSEAQQQQLLSYNQTQQSSYTQQLQANNQKLSVLEAEQAAANRKLDSSGSLVTSGSCGGSYPASASGSYGPWGCNYAHTSDFQAGCAYYDNWGMCNRECVSYTAWMVYQTYGISATDFGNANQWPASARSAGISTGSTPKVGSVAIYMGGSFGHAMWVVGVSGSMIHVYSYNDNYDGNFYDHWVDASGLTYIYFGG